MASPITKTITVPLALDPEGIVRQLEVLRTLASQIRFALDTAILALTPPAQDDGSLGSAGAGGPTGSRVHTDGVEEVK